MESCKLYVVEVPEKFLDNDAYRSTQIWLKNIYKNMQDDATIWLGFNYLNYNKILKLIKEIGFINHLDNWLIIEDEKETRHDYFHLTKKAIGYTWNKVEYKREVIVPYVVNGKPRGWFKDDNGKPVRFTGISNCFYASKLLDVNFSDIVFILLSSNKGDLIDLQANNESTLKVVRALDRKLINKYKDFNSQSPDEYIQNELKKVFGETI